MSKVLDLTTELTARPSVTPDDAGCQRLIVERLQPLGFNVEWFLCGEVSNVLFTRGTGSPSLWFLGHTDVVPSGPEELWTFLPFHPDQKDGELYGRGVADMKGAVAAMVVALETFAQQHPEHGGQMGLLLTSDEEGKAVDGIVRVAEVLRQRGNWPDHCLVGEPSSQATLGDTVRVGRRGSIYVRLKVNGVQGHTAFPENLDNPVHRMAPFLQDLVGQQWDAGDEDFPASHCQVASLRAGTGAGNVTPANVEMLINFRNGPGSPVDSIQERFHKLLHQHGIEDYRVEWEVMGEPFRSPAGKLREAVIGAVGDILHQSPELNTGGGTSDGRYIAPLGTEVLELGLLNTSIHQVDERTPVADLDRLYATYYDIIRRILAS
ncbi:MAG: succinyl-diaminopimelate desuccinylase [Xanthomonadales bacterium]|nr:succinyl-diaminopimelate desuccinylase [Gammaproteobacteria bacterium]MBT8053851.1 succinyl-diaminopimelate desuccinylase [Gammaproteobacteria bacterium]NND58334.1 succinyl-diaminopimelate desuccinylase [Xanthomonadales bacterium]NNK51838.1 succinyl-diaminopimelate desuccinylase [Xanthomonadales bacterium]